MFSLLHTLSAFPNKYQKQKAAQHRHSEFSREAMAQEDEDWEDDPFLKSELNNLQAIIVAISMMAFVCSRATNMLPLLLGLFFKLLGTTSWVMKMLSNAGVCVSGQTIEKLKVLISKNVIHLVVKLFKSGQLFFTIFDNINIFLCKSQQ